MKKIFIVTMILGATLFIACNSGASNKNEQETLIVENEHSKMNHNSGQKSNINIEHAMLGVQGDCEICKERIETAAKRVKGVTVAAWDIKKKELHVSFDSKQTNLDAISKAIAKVGHRTDKDNADPEAYKALPACCKV
jgi:Cu(I)/Ag(I) efflux system membrane fusion protein